MDHERHGRHESLPAGRAGLLPYLRLARPSHWLKNVFLLLGAAVAWLYEPGAADVAWRVAWAMVVACLVASSNYVLNGLLDAAGDRRHPHKHARPAAAGTIRPAIGWAEWLLLGVAGLAAAWPLGQAFFATAAAFWLLALVYNVPPLRAKDVAWIDVLVESMNNPLRLAMGWFAVRTADVPPLSLAIAYWMFGAFLMAAKRLAELRLLGPEVAAEYRRSFRHYTVERLLVGSLTYAVAGGLFLGVFIIRYRLELILSFPIVAALAGYYLHLSLAGRADAPDELYRNRRLLLLVVAATAVFIGLMFVRLPALYGWFNVPPAAAPPLWELKQAAS